VASYKLLITRSASKELEEIPGKDRNRIIAKIRTLEENPRPQGVEKLSSEDKYRLRQGDYRILYEIQDRQLIVTVVRIGNRRDVYRR
jgi:mRNA interferase RelE/StbE